MRKICALALLLMVLGFASFGCSEKSSSGSTAPQPKPGTPPASGEPLIRQ